MLDAIGQVARAPNARVLISGCADHRMLSHVVAAWAEAGRALDGDRCGQVPDAAPHELVAMASAPACRCTSITATSSTSKPSKAFDAHLHARVLRALRRRGSKAARREVVRHVEARRGRGHREWFATGRTGWRAAFCIPAEAADPRTCASGAVRPGRGRCHTRPDRGVDERVPAPQDDASRVLHRRGRRAAHARRVSTCRSRREPSEGSWRMGVVAIKRS